MVFGIWSLGDRETFALAQCTILRGIALPRSNMNSPGHENMAALVGCCAEPQNPDPHTDMPEPKLSSVLLSTPEDSPVTTFCVYGENFGAERRTSVLTVGGAPVSVYREWADPGRPYGPGRLARICGELNRWSRSGEKQVQLTTRNGLSNAMSLRILGSSRETADTSIGPVRRTDLKPNRTAMARLETKVAPVGQ